MSARMTPLSKPDGGIRGITTGTVLRRLVAKTLARQCGPVYEASCAPFQFALSTRAGVDCVGHTIRAATDDNPRMTGLSVDGVGAFDHVLRATMLSKLREVSGLQSLLPFVRQAYSSPSSYSLEEEEGQRHTTEQHEGGEQGDPLMPFFSLAIHNELKDVQGYLESGELLFCVPGRCLRGVFAAPGALHHQFVERQVVHHGWDSPPRANNTDVEQSWRVSRGDCGVGSTSLESRGRQDLGHPSRARGVCGQGGGRTIGGGTEVVGRVALGP